MLSPVVTAPSVAPQSTGLVTSLALAMLLSSLSTSIANVGLPSLALAFDAPFQHVQWVVLAYLLAVTTVVVSVGRLGDLVGRRRLMVAGLAVFTLASLACGAAPTLWMLVAARAAQGLGAAVMMALAMALVVDAVPKARVGTAMGTLGTMSAVGTALGPSAGGLLIDTLGWPAIFFCNVPLGLLALALAHRFLPADRVARGGGSFDTLGSALLALALGAFALAMTRGRSSFGRLGVALLCVALVAAVVFVVVESRVRSPLVRADLLRQRVVSSGFAMSWAVTTVAMTTLVVGPFYLSGVLRLGPAATGLVMAVGPVVAALVGVPAGRAVDRHGAHTVTLVALTTMAFGCAALAALSQALGSAGYVSSVALVTAGFATFQAANNTAVVTCVGTAQRGVVAGLLNLSRNLGLVSGASAMGAVFSYAAGATDVAEAGAQAIASGTHAAFALATLLVVGALLVAFVFARPEAGGSPAQPIDHRRDPARPR